MLHRKIVHCPWQLHSNNNIMPNIDLIKIMVLLCWIWGEGRRLIINAHIYDGRKGVKRSRFLTSSMGSQWWCLKLDKQIVANKHVI